MRHFFNASYDKSKVDSSPAELHGKALSGFLLHLACNYENAALHALQVTAEQCFEYIAEGTPCSLGGNRDYARQAFFGNIEWDRLPERRERVALVEQLLEGYLAGGYIKLSGRLDGAPPLELAIRCYAWPVAAAFIRHGADETSVGVTEYRPPEPRESLFEYIARKVEEPTLTTFMVPAVTQALMQRRIAQQAKASNPTAGQAGQAGEREQFQTPRRRAREL